jgi:hypothetical protein
MSPLLLYELLGVLKETSLIASLPLLSSLDSSLIHAHRVYIYTQQQAKFEELMKA